ncbi:MAG: DUF2188 domain-containing protein [Candidatus Saccharimonadota bacterium]
MSARKVFRVVPNGTNWQVKYEGKVLTNHYTKDAAIDKGRAYALANKPSQLVIHRADGTIETEWTYGDDPYPPRG